MPASPREVAERLIAGVARKDWDEVTALYAEDALVIHPMALPPQPPLEGREALRKHFVDAAELPIEMTVENLVVHQTDDPDVVIAEFEYRGTVTTTSRNFTVANIFVLRVRDGLIVDSRDYANHAAFALAIQ
jgi:ketosteroid isomerase-like protein